VDGDLVYIALHLALNALPSLIERNRSHDALRTQLRRAWAISLTLGQAVVTLALAMSRGYSNASVVLVAGSACMLGCGLLVLLDIRTEPGTQFATPKLYLARPLLRGVESRRGRVPPSLRFLTVCVAMALWLVLPLRFAGALDSWPVAAVTPRQLDPLRTQQEIKVGQCVEKNRAPAPTNEVVPCTHPHDAEVVEAVNPLQPCKPRSSYRFPGLNLEVVSVGEGDTRYRGKVFCVIRSTDTEFKLIQRILLPTTV